MFYLLAITFSLLDAEFVEELLAPGVSIQCQDTLQTNPMKTKSKGLLIFSIGQEFYAIVYRYSCFNKSCYAKAQIQHLYYHKLILHKIPHINCRLPQLFDDDNWFTKLDLHRISYSTKWRYLCVTPVNEPQSTPWTFLFVISSEFVLISHVHIFFHLYNLQAS